MTSMTLDQDKQRFAEWRSQPNQRQPIPDGLWRVACNHISTLGISRVAREFRLNETKLAWIQSRGSIQHDAGPREPAWFPW